jgi:hypothetical protein
MLSVNKVNKRSYPPETSLALAANRFDGGEPRTELSILVQECLFGGLVRALFGVEIGI